MSDLSSITAAELAGRLGGTLKGDGTKVIREVEVLDKAGPDALSWVGTPDLLPKAVESKAGVVLVPEGCSLPAGRTAIGVADPDAALADALELLAPPPDPVEPGVHPTATVSPDADVTGASIGAHVHVGRGAVVGEGTQLYAGVYVGAWSKIGRDCVLWPHVVVRERITIGDRIIIHPNSTIGSDGFRYLFRGGRHRKIPQIGTVVIEDDVEIGANCTVDRARSGKTRIRRGTKIDNVFHIGHNCDIGEDCIMAAGGVIGGSTSLGHHVVLAGHVGIADHVRIGAGAQIAGKSTVTTDVPDGSIVRGIPAIDTRRFARQQAALRRLPKWMERLRDLAKRIEQLEEQQR